MRSRSIYPTQAASLRLYQIEKEVAAARAHHLKTRPEAQAFSQSTLPDILYSVLLRLDLPKASPFSDLGSGFGAACFAAALYFERVVGLELDPQRIAAAEKIKHNLGFNNVTFITSDLRQADLAAYKVLYFFQPFEKDFLPEMQQVLERSREDTIIISNTAVHMRDLLFPASDYVLIYPPQPEPYPTNIYAYQKTSSNFIRSA